MLEDAGGITFLDEGTHSFRLQNGAFLKVYASPYTPTLGEWGFQYHPDRGHDFTIHNVDVAMTHGPPKGVMDYTYSSERAGCPYLFETISRARPRLHCFGHIHEGWGAKLVTWRHKTSAKPSHLSDIDNGRSTVIDKLSTLSTVKSFSTTSHCSGDKNQLQPGSQTLFVNASIEGAGGFPTQPPWLVELELPPASDQEN
ncbi:Metallo-dependent phosphatase-like protein [Penicillium lividum]|nr:Metallo-dependent phosphatase-like protein [Penicillium lividum]